MAEEPADIALAFARECLGWDDAFMQEDGIVVTLGTGDVPSEQFTYRDLSVVVLALGIWCQRLALWWRLGNCDAPDDVYCEIGIKGDGAFIGQAVATAPDEACMKAALKAHSFLTERNLIEDRLEAARQLSEAA